MSEHPEIKSGDWITVGEIDCVVSVVYPKDSPSGVCLAVFNKQKPTTHDVGWDGSKWVFPQRPDYGGYGRDDDPYVQQLKRGRYV